MTSFLAALLFNAPAATWWVSPTGDDGRGDGSATRPFQTISRAVDVARVPGTIRLAPGRFEVVAPILLPPRVNLIGSGVEKTTLTGKPGVFGERKAFEIGLLNLTSEFKPGLTNGDQTVSDFTVDGSVDGKRDEALGVGTGIKVSGRNRVRLSNLALRNTTLAGIDVRGTRYAAADSPAGNIHGDPPAAQLPPGWAKGIVIRDCRLDDCSRTTPGASYGNVMIGTLDGADVSGLRIRSAHGYGIKTYGGGFLKRTRIHHNDIAVTAVDPTWGAAISIELQWSYTDNEVDHNQTTSWMSLVYGSRLGGKRSLWVHDNRIVYPPGSRQHIGFEGSASDLEIANNYVEGANTGVAAFFPGGEGNHRVLIHHNVFANIYGGFSQGVLMQDSAPTKPLVFRDWWIVGNTFVNERPAKNGVIGLRVNKGSRAPGLQMLGNVFANPAGDGTELIYQVIEGAPDPGTVIRDNLVWKCRPLGSPGEVVADPRFRLSGLKPSQFYGPADRSGPTVDRGPSFVNPFTGKPLPYRGSAPDLGAIEFRG